MLLKMLILALTILTGTGVPMLLAQSLEFEVATVKVNRTNSGRSNFPSLRNGTLTAQNVSMLELLQAAYDVSALRVTGPEWLSSDRFDLVGRSPEGVPDSELMPMLQALLKDRFRLFVHREMKETPVYEMIVAKSGVKMLPYDPRSPLLLSPPNRGGSVIIGSSTMLQLANRITASADRPVINKTGLEGRYTYALTFFASVVSPAEGAPPIGESSDLAAPDLFAAVQQQLGLKLVPKKEVIEILVVDHADRVPSEN
jgi:uncharacterized protein (TIGR03435 family)